MRTNINKLFAILMFVVVSSLAAKAQRKVTAIEYFFDTDPGFNLATPVAVTTPASDLANLSIPINLNGLAPGMHTFYIRTKNAANLWSLTNFSKVYVEAFYSSAPSTGPIHLLEYFIDTDPGFGKATPVDITTPAADLADLSIPANLNGLATGMHTFYIRTKNVENLWSLTNWSKFYVEGFYPSSPATGPIRRLEYFIDTDPGFGKATPVDITPGQTEIANLSFSINLSAVPEGNHYLYIRTLDDEWGLTNVVLFRTNTPLPVELINFSAKKEGTNALLSWQTSSEQNNASFDVERSSNGFDFVKIGHVNGRGNSTSLQTYTLKDIKPGAGINYYRLRQLDIDGRSTLSEIRMLEFTAQSLSLKVFPNPATQYIQLKVPENFYGQSASVNIFDGSGKLVKQWTIAQIQLSALTLPVAELPSGAWYIMVTTKDQSASGKFIK